jgi:hypothetical protein
MDRELPQPDRDRLSSLTALVLLTYTLIRIVVLPSIETEFYIFGLVISLEFNTRFVMLTLAAALAVAGADWLIRSHPNIEQGQVKPEHWVIPGLAALGAGTILTRIPQGPGLWIGLILTALVLMAVLVAEFIAFNKEDPRFDTAAIGLTALAYLLLIGAIFAVLAIGLRAAFAVPLILMASGAVSWRLLRLSRSMNGALRYSALISAITAQIAWGLHYWPIPPLRGALVLGLIIYLGYGLALTHQEGKIEAARLIEFTILAIIALAAILALT